MSIAEKIYKVYKGYVGAEAELYEAVMEVESLRVHRLGFLSKRVEDRRAFISIYGEELWVTKGCSGLNLETIADNYT